MNSKKKSTSLAQQLKSQLSKFPDAKKLILACSGGVDSVGLAHLLKDSEHDIVLAHFNHGWRGKQSDEDQKFVKGLAKQWKLKIEVGQGSKAAGGNAEAKARQERYAFLESVRQKHKADYIAVAHHQDDQIETIWMHKKRGAGLRGLAGMPLIQGKIIRPFLEIPKSEILKYAQSKKLKWREDASNQNLSFTRNRLRHVELPNQRKQDCNFDQKLLAESREARKKLEKMQKEARIWIHKNLKAQGFSSVSFQKAPDDLKAEILIQIVGQKDLYSPTLKRAMDWIAQGQSGTRLTIKNINFFKEHDRIAIQPKNAPQPVPGLTEITRQGIVWGDWKIRKTTDRKLFVRDWQPGDRFVPSGMKGNKKVQDLFVDQKIPLSERKAIPLIINEKNDIIAIGNLRVAQGEEELKGLLKIEREND